MGGERGRLISQEDKSRSVELVKEAMNNGASKSECCNILEISVITDLKLPENTGINLPLNLYIK